MQTGAAGSVRASQSASGGVNDNFRTHSSGDAIMLEGHHRSSPGSGKRRGLLLEVSITVLDPLLLDKATACHMTRCNAMTTAASYLSVRRRVRTVLPSEAMSNPSKQTGSATADHPEGGLAIVVLGHPRHWPQQYGQCSVWVRLRRPGLCWWPPLVAPPLEAPPLESELSEFLINLEELLVHLTPSIVM
ncbi:hypothetical protein EYF80_010028 [Liparis tanakae]|uniref:Uncharacterized protein n=1 Tax=Liparis tanakae TaxID=230148 RepID=A0A4Z2IQ67_9TELE|nr:hypothetical protein EYF80_010028 [Liparis tanakae]